GGGTIVADTDWCVTTYALLLKEKRSTDVVELETTKRGTGLRARTGSGPDTGGQGREWIGRGVWFSVPCLPLQARVGGSKENAAMNGNAGAKRSIFSKNCWCVLICVAFCFRSARTDFSNCGRGPFHPDCRKPPGETHSHRLCSSLPLPSDATR